MVCVFPRDENVNLCDVDTKIETHSGRRSQLLLSAMRCGQPSSYIGSSVDRALCSVHTGLLIRYDFCVHTAKICVLIEREHTRHLVCTKGKLQQLWRYTSRRNSILARWLAEAFHVIPRGDLRLLRFATNLSTLPINGFYDSTGECSKYRKSLTYKVCDAVHTRPPQIASIVYVNVSKFLPIYVLARSGGDRA